MQEKRQVKRFNKIMDVIISRNPIKKGMIETLSTCKNISQKGIQLELMSSYRMGDLLYLRCFSNTKTDYIDVMCEVVWVERTINDYYNIGLKFLNITIKDFQLLTQF